MLHSLSTLIFINIIMAHSTECESVLFITNHVQYRSEISGLCTRKTHAQFLCKHVLKKPCLAHVCAYLMLVFPFVIHSHLWHSSPSSLNKRRLRGFSNSFSNSFTDFYSCEVVSSNDDDDECVFIYRTYHIILLSQGGFTILIE